MSICSISPKAISQLKRPLTRFPLWPIKTIEGRYRADKVRILFPHEMAKELLLQGIFESIIGSNNFRRAPGDLGFRRPNLGRIKKTFFRQLSLSGSSSLYYLLYNPFRVLSCRKVLLGMWESYCLFFFFPLEQIKLI